MNEIVSYCLSYCLLYKSRYTLNAKRKVVIPDVNNETSCVRDFQKSNTIVRERVREREKKREGEREGERERV